MHWRLLIKEFGPELLYISKVKNIIAYVLSHMEINEKEFSVNAFALNEDKDNHYPLTLKELAAEHANI